MLGNTTLPNVRTKNFEIFAGRFVGEHLLGT